MKDSILILGGTSMVGKNLQQSFKEQGLEGIFIGRGQNDEYNLLSATKTNHIFEQFSPKKIIFLSGNVGGIKKNLNESATLIHDNLQMGINVLNACRDFKIENLYIGSTTCMYPAITKRFPFKEDDIFEGAEHESNRAYSTAKRTIMVMANAYRKSFGLKSTCLIFANLFGFHDHFNDLENSHVVPALIEKFVIAKRDNLPEVKCWGSGKISRDLFFCKDLSDTLVDIVKSNFDHDEPINLGTGVETYISDLAEMIKELVGYQGRIIFDGSVSDGQLRRALDTTRAYNLLNGWKAKTSLRDGLIETIQWYRENYMK